MVGYSAVATEASYIDDDKLFGATAEYPTTLVKPHLHVPGGSEDRGITQ